MFLLNFKYGKKSLKGFKSAERGSLKTKDRVTVFLPRAQNRNVRKMGHHPLLFENLSWFFWQKPHWHFVRRHLLRATFFLLHLMHAPKEKTKLLRPKSLSPHFICHLCIFLEAQEKASLMQKKVFRILFDVK